MKTAARPVLLLSLVLLAVLAVPALAPAADTAPVLGTWDAVATSPEGDLAAVITVRQVDGVLKAEIDLAGLKRTVTNEKLEGNVLSMTVEYEGNPYDVRGKVEGDLLEGTWQGSGYSGTLKAKRRP